MSHWASQGLGMPHKWTKVGSRHAGLMNVEFNRNCVQTRPTNYHRPSLNLAGSTCVRSHSPTKRPLAKDDSSLCCSTLIWQNSEIIEYTLACPCSLLVTKWSGNTWGFQARLGLFWQETSAGPPKTTSSFPNTIYSQNVSIIHVRHTKSFRSPCPATWPICISNWIYT